MNRIIQSPTNYESNPAVALALPMEIKSLRLPLPQRLAELLLRYTDYRNGTIRNLDFTLLAKEMNTSRENIGVLIREFVRTKAARVGYRRIDVIDVAQLSKRAGQDTNHGATSPREQ